MNKYPKEVKDFIYNNYIGIGNKELTNLINANFGTFYTVENIKRYKANHKLNSGLTGHYKKGHTPYNKGKKMPLKLYEKCKNTMFKKGNKPHNYKPIGTERIGKDGYMQIKVADPNKWQQKNVYLYEKYHKIKIPKGYKVIFLDQDKYNFDISNLELIKNSIHGAMCVKNRFSKNSQITKAAKTLTMLEQKIKDKQCKPNNK